CRGYVREHRPQWRWYRDCDVSQHPAVRFSASANVHAPACESLDDLDSSMHQLPPRARIFCSVAVMLIGVASAPALDLTRGPYLQTATPTSIIIRWRTDEPTESLVHYGIAPTNLHLIAGDLSQSTEHIVEIGGLDPATRYYYSVGDLDEEFIWGPEYFFFTHPVPGTVRPTRIWAIGDCGTFNTGAGNQVGVRDAYYAFAGTRHTDVWLALGDNAYYSGTDAEYQANFFDIYLAKFRNTVLWSTLGNHETYSPIRSEE